MHCVVETAKGDISVDGGSVGKVLTSIGGIQGAVCSVGNDEAFAKVMDMLLQPEIIMNIFFKFTTLSTIQ